MFAGRLLRFVRLRETAAECAEGGAGEPMVPAYEGGRLPLTTNLADRVRGLLQTPRRWGLFPEPVQEWLRLQRGARACPAATTCWSRPSRAATAGIWSPIASRAATRTRRWACC